MKFKGMFTQVILWILLLVASVSYSQAPLEEDVSTDSAPIPESVETVEIKDKATAPTTLTPYSATYESYYRWGFLSFKITGERHLEHIENNVWQMSFEAEASAASVDETSIFNFDGQSIRPISYRYRASGLIQEDDRTLEFDHTDRAIVDKERNIRSSDDWQDGLQDMLSYMQQASIDLAQGKSELDYPVYDKTRIKHYRFEVIGEETLSTRIGALNTLKIRQIRKGDRQVYAWLAIDKDYILVQMEDKDDGDLKYRIQLVNLKLDE